MADTADPSGVFASGVRMERHRRGGQGGHHHKKPSTKAPEELLDISPVSSFSFRSLTSVFSFFRHVLHELADKASDRGFWLFVQNSQTTQNMLELRKA